MLLKFDGVAYAINWDKYAEIFSAVKRSDTASNTTVSQTYGLEPGDKEMSIPGKEMVEVRYSGNDTVQGLKYDSLKMILECALRPADDTRNGTDTMTFGQVTAINTLIEMGIIYKVVEENA